MVYTVTFNPAIDCLVHLADPLRPGQVNRAAREEYQFGGKGINVSRVLLALGCPSAALGFVAGYTGLWLEEGLARAGLTTDFVRLAQGVTRINLKLKAGQETEINGRGPDIAPAELDQLLARLDRLGSGDILVLAGSIPACLPGDTYQNILARLEGRGVQVVVDAARELLEKTLAYRPFLIKPNHLELGELFGRTLTTEQEILDCAARLQARGARNVLVSRAGDGALLLDETGARWKIGAPRGRVQNSVGAGDSMVAGFLAGWLKTGDYGQALRLGAAAGSATAFSAGLATRPEIDRILGQLDLPQQGEIGFHL